MQLIFFSVLALLLSAASSLSLVARQQGAPSCALNCLATTPTGSCGTDDTCLCHDESFLEAQLACVKKACVGQDFAAAQQFAIALCQAAGVDLTTDTSLLLQATSSSGGSATPTSSSGSAAPTTTSPSATSPAPSTTQTSGAISLDVRAAAGLLVTVAGIALTL